MDTHEEYTAIIERLGKGEEIMKRNKALSYAVLSTLAILVGFLWYTNDRAGSNQVEIAALIEITRAAVADVEGVGRDVAEYQRRFELFETEIEAKIDGMANRLGEFWHQVDAAKADALRGDHANDQNTTQQVQDHEDRFEHRRLSSGTGGRPP